MIKMMTSLTQESKLLAIESSEKLEKGEHYRREREVIRKVIQVGSAGDGSNKHDLKARKSERMEAQQKSTNSIPIGAN